MDENKTVSTIIREKVEDKLKELSQEELEDENIEKIYKLIDIHKDLANEVYWKLKEDNMYRDYGNYNGYNEGYGRRDARGRYAEESYGRRGVAGSGRGRYRGEEMLDEMSYHYGNYKDSNNYGAKEDSAYKMTEAFKEFIYAVGEELDPKDKQLFKQAMQEMLQKLN